MAFSEIRQPCNETRAQIRTEVGRNKGASGHRELEPMCESTPIRLVVANESWETLSDAAGKLAPNCIGDSDEERNQRDDERDEADGAHDVGTVRMECRGKKQ